MILKDGHVYLQGKYRESDMRSASFENEITRHSDSLLSATDNTSTKILTKIHIISNIDTPVATGGLCLPAIRSY